MTLEYVFAILIAVVVFFVSISIIRNATNPNVVPQIGHPVDVRYACGQYNETSISFETFKTLLYGFLTGQCKHFVGELNDGVTIDDLRRAAKEIDETAGVISLTSCESPTVNAHNIYFCCNETLEKHKVFNITGNGIKNSDVLICQ